MAEKKQENGAQALAEEILRLARDSVLVQLRFLDVALSRIKAEPRPRAGCVASDGDRLLYDPVYLLRRYQEDAGYGARLYLHALLHSIFFHPFQYNRLDRRLWDLSVDIAVENVILEMKLPSLRMQRDEEAVLALRELAREAGELTAERLYRHFREKAPGQQELEELEWLFYKDSHELWAKEESEELFVTQEMFRKISERVKADLKSFSRGKSRSESMEKNLAEATRDRYDYGALLERFTVMGEDVQINEDEFDYIYYTYGLSHYGNMPLIEPLEYRDVKKVREFVIALDTSASCKGELLRSFVRRTYSILKGTEHFFQKINVRILQCDSEVRSDVKITSQEDLERFLKEEKLKGFGTTDFRPVFEHVQRLREEGAFENLKGLIYFTDGYGEYPERMPGYDVIFAFPEEDDRRPETPPWAIRAVIGEEELEEKE